MTEETQADRDDRADAEAVQVTLGAAVARGVPLTPELLLSAARAAAAMTSGRRRLIAELDDRLRR